MLRRTIELLLLGKAGRVWRTHSHVVHSRLAHLVESLLHELAAVAALHQRVLRGDGCSPEAEEALWSAVSQQAQQGVGLLRLHRLEAGEGRDVARLGPKPHHFLAVFVVHQLLLRDLLHLLAHTLGRRSTGAWSHIEHGNGTSRKLELLRPASPLPPCC